MSYKSLRTPVCSVSSCDRTKYARTLCKAHYIRLHTTGDLKESVPIGAIATGGRKPGFSCLESTKEKISKANKGKTTGRIAWNKGKTFMAGDKHPNWKGGITAENKLQRHKFYSSIRLQALERDNYTCVICQKHGGDLQVDHIEAWAKNPDKRFELDNCRTLCVPCHYYVTFKKSLTKSVSWGKNSGSVVV